MSPSTNGGGGSAAVPMIQEFTGRIMNFLSAANGETIGACAVGLGAVTYFVLGRVGLVIIGAVGGVVLHATWDGQNTQLHQLDAAEAKRRKEVGVDIVRRLLDMRYKQSYGEKYEVSEDPKAEADLMLASGKELNFGEFPPETRSALTALVDAVIRDYVKYWYAPILPQEVLFPYTCRQTLVGFMLSLSRHVSRKRPADAFLNFLTNSTSIFIVFLSELSHALMAPGMYDRNVSEAIKIYLEEKPDSSLANLLNRDQQEKKFKLIAQDVLETFLDSKTYNCEPARMFSQQILAGLILESVLKSCSQAHWINGWIIYLLEEGEPELMNAIDAGVGGATGMGDVKSARAESETVKARPDESNPATLNTEKAMTDAMAEVRRLNEMIAKESSRQPIEQDVAENTASALPTDRVASATSLQNNVQPSEHDNTVHAVPIQQDKEELDSDMAPELTPVPPRAFTSFDQILPPHQESPDPSEPPPLTLHRAKIVLFDDEKPGEKGTLRSKPNIEYLLQIEPASAQHSGWMAARSYADFETLHEFTSRVAKISGITAFSTKYSNPPSWKGKTKASLRAELEGYLQDALSHEGLAESEGMKRFLEKERALGRPEPTKGVLGFPTPEAFQNMGKEMLNVMSAAPKGVAGGGQAFIKGVTGVFGGPKRASSNNSHSRSLSRTNSYNTQTPSVEGSPSIATTSSFDPRPSQESLRTSSNDHSEDTRPPPLPSRSSISASLEGDSLGIISGRSSQPQSDSQSSSIVDVSRPSSRLVPSETSSTTDIEAPMNLPPPPSEIEDDYGVTLPASHVSPTSHARTDTSTTIPSQPNSTEPSTLPSAPPTISTADDIDPVLSAELSPPPEGKPSGSSSAQPLTEDETKVALELIFAVINELYTLSSAWQIRRTLLNTAKTFLLRPGNASLSSIRTLLQTSVLDAQLSDAGIAAQLRTLRANALPTEAEAVAWADWPPKADAQERMRDQSRRLLLARGVPPALMSVMGASASAEALGRVFDALQIEEVARGLMFAMLLQAVRAVTH